MKLIITERIGHGSYRNTRTVAYSESNPHAPLPKWPMFRTLIEGSPYNSGLLDNPDKANEIFSALLKNGKVQWGWADYEMVIL